MSSSVPENIDPNPPNFVPTHPFANTPGADAILRSRDGADFYVHRAMLSLVSPFFETTFTLPQPESTPAVPIIDIQEDAPAIDRALRFFYPGAQPNVATLEELHEVIEILVSKYDMEHVVPMAKQHLEKYFVSQPLGVYAVAFAHRWEDVARVAAKECLKLSLRVMDTEAAAEIKHLTSIAYHNLLHYHFQCGEAAKRTTQDLLWIQNPALYCWFTCGNCAYQPPVLLSDGSRPSPRSWFMTFFKAMGDRLATRPMMNLRQDPLFFDAIRSAVLCAGNCRTQALDCLSSFITVWEAKIADEIAKVEWKF
ncbi:hypothetical protein B0H13DRAFT_608208 [Mycena leptocephala]|nr:hypothetical protein B0H13DRAFT_608208 [Mycena leptocephala]